MKLPPFPPSWEPFFSDYFQKEQAAKLLKFIRELPEEEAYPQRALIFNAFHLCPLKSVKVVILGQDPYHGEGQAHGLAFSVPQEIKIPPSLRNIYKELEDDLSLKKKSCGDLTSWAHQGVLLLNTVLTVRPGAPASHQKQGWEELTNEIIKEISNTQKHVAFILWGSPAQKKEQLINKEKHLILKAPHPSPLSSYRGFFGSRPFSTVNHFLTKTGSTPITW